MEYCYVNFLLPSYNGLALEWIVFKINAVNRPINFLFLNIEAKK